MHKNRGDKLEKMSHAAPPQVEADLHFRLCKKVAQLTKVVYTLNCRSEDNDARTEWLKMVHKEEIDRMAEECKKRMSAMATKVHQAEEEKRKTISHIEAKHHASIKEAQNLFTERTQKLTIAIENAKGDYEVKLREMKGNSEQVLADEVSRLQQKKDSEIQGLVVQYNEKYKAMLAEQMDLRDELEKRLLEEHRTEVEALSKELADSQRMLTDQLEGRGKALRDALGKSGALTQQVTELTHQMKQLEESRNILEVDNNALRTQLSAEQASLDESRKTEARLREETCSLKSSLGTHTAELAEAKKDCEAAERKARRLTSTLQNSENERATMETLKNAAENELASLKGELTKACAELADLKKHMATVSSSAENQQSVLTDLRKAVAAAEAERDALEVEHQAKVREMQATHQDALRNAKETSDRYGESMMQKLRDEKAVMESQLQEQLRDAHAAGRDSVAKIQQELQTRIDELTADLLSASSYRGNLDDLRVALAASEEKLQRSQHLYAQLCADGEKRAADNQAAIAALHEELHQLKSQREEDFNANRQAADAAEANLKAQLAAQQRDREGALQSLRAEMELQLSKERHEYLVALEIGKQAHDAAMQEAQAAAQQQLRAVQSEGMQELLKTQEEAAQCHRKDLKEAEATQLQLQRVIGDLQERLHVLSDALDGEKLLGSNRSSEMEGHIRQLQERMATMAEEHRTTMAAAEAAAAAHLSATLKTAQQSHTLEREDLNRKLAAAEEAHREEVTTLKTSHRDHTTAAEKRFRQQMEERIELLSSEHTNVIANLNVMHGVQTKELQSRADESISLLQLKLGTAAKNSESLSHQVNTLRAEINRLQEELGAAQKSAEQERRHAEEVRQALLSDHEHRVEDLETRHAVDLNRLAADHKRIFDDFSRQMVQERAGHQASVESLRKAYEELEHKYKFRESRPEDVELINQLLQEKHDLTKDLAKAYEDMKIYKLELINREENYNKLFGRRPIVAAPPEINASRSLPTIPTRAAVSK